MIKLNKKEVIISMNDKLDVNASVCSSCACGGGSGSCNTTCKGCKDKNDNIKNIQKIYK